LKRLYVIEIKACCRTNIKSIAVNYFSYNNRIYVFLFIKQRKIRDGRKPGLCGTNMVFPGQTIKYIIIFMYIRLYTDVRINSACTLETSIAAQWIKTRLFETINQNLINLRFVSTIMLCYCLLCRSRGIMGIALLRQTLSRI